MDHEELASILVRTATAAIRSDNPDEANLSLLLHGAAAALVHGKTDLPDSEVEHWTRWAKAIQRRDPQCLTDGELLELAAKERRSTLRAPTFDLSNLGAWNGSRATTKPIWGDSSNRFALANDRSTLIYGNDGAGKTNLAGLIAAGALGCPGFGTLLGYPIQPLADSQSVLVLAFNGPEETRQSYARFGLTEDTPRLIVFAGTPPWDSDTANSYTLAAFVSAIETETTQTFGLIIIDNAQRAYGAVDTTTRAAIFGSALNRLESPSRAVVVLAQAKKNRKPTTKDDAMLGSLGLSGMGSIISLHRLKQGKHDGTKPTTSELRHHKGIGSDSDKATVVSFDLITGRATIEGEGPSDELLGRIEQLPTTGTFTRADVETVWNVSDAQARKLLKKAAEWNLITLDGEGTRGRKYWRRTKSPAHRVAAHTKI